VGSRRPLARTTQPMLAGFFSPSLAFWVAGPRVSSPSMATVSTWTPPSGATSRTVPPVSLPSSATTGPARAHRGQRHRARAAVASLAIRRAATHAAAEPWGRPLVFRRIGVVGLLRGPRGLRGRVLRLSLRWLVGDVRRHVDALPPPKRDATAAVPVTAPTRG